MKSRISLKQYLKPSQLKKYFKDQLVFGFSKNGKSLNKTIPGKFQSYLAYGKPILVSSKGYLGNLIKSKEIGFSNNPNEIKKIVKNMNNLNNINEKENKNLFKIKKVYEEFFELDKIVNDLSKHINYISKKNAKKIYYRLPRLIQDYINKAAAKFSNNSLDEFIYSDIGKKYNLSNQDKSNIVRRIQMH